MCDDKREAIPVTAFAGKKERRRVRRE